jgi:Alr-MurF fusion protein
MIYTVREIATFMEGELKGSEEQRIINHLIIDSRHLVSAEDSLFFALKGKRHDGHDFIESLYERGIRAFVVSRLPDNYKTLSEACIILVQDTLIALQRLAELHRKRFTYPVIGITGSNGKTIVKEWLYQLLRSEYHVVRSPRSFNSQVGVPLSVWQMGEDHNMAVFEAGISEPGEMEKHRTIIQPEIGVFTNIGQAHQESFTSMEQKVLEKLKLFDACKTLIYCRDHKDIHQALAGGKGLFSGNTFTWSLHGDADLLIRISSSTKGATEVTAQHGEQSYRFSIPFSNSMSVENALHCFALMVYIGSSPEHIRKGMASLEQVEMRLELKKGINECTIVNDSYNSDLASLEVALDFLNQLNQHRQRTVVLSDIFQTGLKADRLYKQVFDMLSRKKIHRLIGIGHSLLGQKDQYKGKAEFYSSTEEFISSFSEAAFFQEAILVKGSRDFAFERITALLEQKVHQTVMEINLSALVHNLNHFRSKLSPGVKIAVVVKAFSYGIGSWEIANLLQFHRVDYLAVAFTQEGTALRKAGITLPIMVMNPDDNSWGQMIDHHLEPEIYRFSQLSLVARELEKRGISNYPVHIKLDTGMHRLGFMESDLVLLKKELSGNKQFHVKSVFSHLAASDEPEHDAFTHDQISLFKAMCDQLQTALSNSFIRHILNSGGIERFPEAQFDMVRLGIGLYGVSTQKPDSLMQVASLKSVISQLRELPAGETVGYSRKGNPGRPVRVAVVPVGYADGIDRRLGNGAGRMLVNRQPAKTIGTICMDMCMLDVTDIQAAEGDEVIVFGKEHTISEMADTLNTIPYEILSSISARVKRIYLQE